MNVEHLRKVHQARPFRPFTLHIADGRAITVPHPEFLAQFPTGRAVIVTQANDDYEVIDLLLVSSIEVRNGRQETT